MPSESAIERRLTELGLVVPDPPTPAGMYVPGVRSGNHVYLSGTGPKQADGSYITGKVGAEVDLATAQHAARLTGLGLLASLRAVIGDLDRVVRLVKVLGMVDCAPGFTNTPGVIDGCSGLFIEVFGEAGRGARSAVGMSALPFGICVEIEAIFEVRD